MIQRLALMRHAKSSWSDPSLSDWLRPLNKRGRRTAPAVGRHLAAIEWRPDYVACSPATRARETWSRCADALGGAPNVQIHQGLYPGDPAAVAAILEELDETVDTLMVIAHNPGLEMTVESLCGEWVELKTADVALLVRAPNAVPSAPSPCWRLEGLVRGRAVVSGDPNHPV